MTNNAVSLLMAHRERAHHWRAGSGIARDAALVVRQFAYYGDTTTVTRTDFYFWGYPVEVDYEMPEDAIALLDSDGELLGSVDMETQQTPRRQAEPLPTEEEWNRFSEYNKRFLEEQLATTGPTTRLSRACQKCGDTLPDDAKFCIECGAPTV